MDGSSMVTQWYVSPPTRMQVYDCFGHNSSIDVCGVAQPYSTGKRFYVRVQYHATWHLLDPQSLHGTGCNAAQLVLFQLIQVDAIDQGQYMDGLRTPFILHDTVEAYPYDEELIVTLTGNVVLMPQNK